MPKMRDPKDLPTAEQVRELFAYSPLTGELIWKPRPVTRYRDTARNKTWNRLWAGKTAGSVDPNGYWRVTFSGQTHYVHRVIWAWETGEWPPGELDHANGNPSDNRLWNIRLA